MTTEIIKKPFSLKLSGPGYRVFQEVCTHVRNGYVVKPDTDPQIMLATGYAFVTLVLGTPQTYAEADAEATIKLALETEQAESDRAADAAAKRLVEEEKTAAIRKELGALTTEHAKAMRKLENALAASQAAQAAIQ